MKFRVDTNFEGTLFNPPFQEIQENFVQKLFYQFAKLNKDTSRKNNYHDSTNTKYSIAI